MKNRPRCGAGLVGAFVLASVSACGARSGLGTDDAPDDASPRDGAERSDASMPPDASRLVECPVVTGIGFRSVPLEPIPLEAEATGAVSVAGDGRRALVAAELADTPPRVVVVDLDSGRSVAAFTRARQPHLSAADDAFALAYVGTEELTIELRVLRGDEVTRAERMRIRGEPESLMRPLYDGNEWLLGATNGFEVFFGPLVDGRIGNWLAFGPGGPRVRSAFDPDRSETNAIVFVPPGRVRLFRWDREGTELTGEDGTHLEEVEWTDVTEIGFDDDGLDQPFVVAGPALGDEGETRFTVRRYRHDASAGSGFSARLTEAGSFDLSAVAPPGHRTGYGFVGVDREPDRDRIRFHGAGETFVAGSQDIAFERTRVDSVSIGPHRCGYVVAWIAPEARSTLNRSVLVARPPD